jgi:ATP-binding cassette, subfamily B, bacterial
MTRIKDLPKASVADVFRVFWRAVYPQRWAMYVAIVTTVITDVLQLITPLYYKRFFDAITSGGDKMAMAPHLINILVIILALNGTAWVFFRFGFFATNKLEPGVMARLKQISFTYLMDHSYSFFSNNFTGALIQRVNRFSRAFERLFDTFIFNFLPLLIGVAGAIVVVWFQEPMIAVAILIWTLVTMVVNYFFSRWKVKYDLRSVAADSATTAQLADTITNQGAVSSFTASDYEADAFKEISNEQARAMRLTWDINSILDGIQAAFAVAVEFFIFYYAVKFWERDAITIGTFVLIQVYLLGLMGKMWNFSRIIRNVYEGFADSEEMVSVLILPHEVKDVSGARPLMVDKGKIELKHVSFAFAENHRVLEDLDFTIRGGEKIALIGPSGAGKSTFVRLILRLYNLPDGTILIDGQDIQGVTQESLRRNISLVPQDPVLFHRTLLENIRYGRRDATDEEVKEAARRAHCDEFADALPLKYGTFVGERGIKLSGGERQRIAIARAILKNAPILVLDEATSSLDSHSEALIQDALSELMKGKTSIVIAHRLSTIRKMNRIIVIQNGKIVEEGTHRDLVAREKSLYKHLWNLQAGGFITE